MKETRSILVLFALSLKVCRDCLRAPVDREFQIGTIFLYLNVFKSLVASYLN